VATAVAALAANASINPLVLVAERRALAQAVERRDHAERPIAEHQRDHELRVCAEPLCPRCAQPRRARIDPPGPARLERLTGERAVDRHDRLPHIGRDVPRRGHDVQLVAVSQSDEHRASLDERAAPLDDQLEDPFELQLATDRARHLGRRLERAHRPLQLVASPAHVLVEPRVLDRDRRPIGQNDERRLVGLGELRAPGLLREVQIAPGGPPHDDRDAEERVHLGMADREAVGAGCSSTSSSRSGTGWADQLAQHAAPPRQVADRSAFGLRRCRG
jgi:hypothetical protein